jgi:hypothetical protein
MELKDRLKKIMKEQFGITSDEELIRALQNDEPVDLGIFVTPIRGTKNEQTA